MSEENFDKIASNTSKPKGKKHYDSRILETDPTLRWVVILFVLLSASVFLLASL